MASTEEMEQQRAAADMLAELQEQMRKISVGDYLIYIMQSVSAMGLRKLGLSPETAGERDLEQSRMAIDAFKALLNVVERARPADEVTAHRAMLSQMQLAYVASLNPPSGPEPGDDAGPELQADAAPEAQGGSLPEPHADAEPGPQAEAGAGPRDDAGPETQGASGRDPDRDDGPEED